MSFAVYAYADANRNQDKISSDELNWTGTWSASGSYYASTLDTVLYGDTRYVAIINNVGVNPLARLPNKVKNPFSALVVLQAGDEPPFSPPIPAPPTQDVLYDALLTAWSGTAAARAAINLANHALVTAWIGTNASGSAQSYQALQTAWQGTATASQALALAEQALLTSYAGTNAVIIAEQALAASFAGTNAINLANQVYVLATAGTNEASGAITIANKALTTAWTGTNEAAAAITLANQALSLAFVGTTTGGGDSAQSFLALQTAWTGTALAYTALQTAWTGTSSGSAAIQLANHATQLAWIGTNALPTTGGVITGNLTIAGGKFDAANGTFADKLYTKMFTAQTWRNTHVTLTYGTIVNIDYNRGSAFTLACQGDVEFTETNRVDSALAKIAIFTGLGTTSFTWPNWVIIGTPLPDMLLGGKHAIVTLECYGANVGDVWATYESEV